MLGLKQIRAHILCISSVYVVTDVFVYTKITLSGFISAEKWCLGDSPLGEGELLGFTHSWQ